MNWGHKIAALYIAFAGGIIFLVIMASRQSMDLVVNDYYEQELVYQNRINAMENVRQLSSAVQVQAGNGKMKVELPAEMQGRVVDAEVYLYCPSDAGKDFRKQVSSSSGALETEIPSLSGSFTLKLSWKSEGKEYYHQENLFL